MVYKFQQFMIGRYGIFDALTKFLLVVYLIFGVLTIWLPVFQIVNLLLLVFIFYRLLSKNISMRQRENQMFSRIFDRVSGKLRLWNTIRKDRTHKYFTCPKCKSTLRIPKPASHKKIELHCTKCGHYFIKKV